MIFEKTKISMVSFDPSKESTAKVHSIFLGAVAPRPIAFASTIDRDGNPNLSPFSFFNCFGAKPPILIFSPARRVRDNTIKHTLENVREVPEVVINVVNYAMVQQVSLSSVEYPKGVNEFIKAGFTPEKSQIVKPFRVKESPVQMECKVLNIIETGTEGGAGNLIICEVVLFHVNEQVLTDDGKIDPNKIDLVARMGGDYYCRASGESVFSVEKPNVKISIGVDSIPEEIRRSNVLTGNNLGQLGNLEQLPTASEINDFPKLQFNLSNTESKHQEAKKLLDAGKVKEAWIILLS